MKNVNRRKQNYIFEILIALGIIGVGTYFSLHLAFVSVQKYDKKPNVVEYLTAASEHMSKSPYEFDFGKKDVQNKFLDLQKYFLLLYAVGGLLIYASMGMNKGEFAGVEHGSASWASNPQLKPFRKKSNTIIGQKLYLQKEDKKKDYNHNRFIIGGSKSGKSFRDIMPNILLAEDNYIVTDIKGEIYRNTANRLKNEGYRVKVLNLIELKYSMHFNPFYYINNDEDILILANTFLKNTDNGLQTGDSFWVKAEQALLQAIIFYIYHELPQTEHTFANCLKLLLCASDLGEIVENGKDKAEESLNVLNTIFQELAAAHEKSHIAVENYKMFKLAAGETAAGILIGLAVRFSIFTTDAIKEMTSYDEMELDKLATDKIAIYMMIPDTNRVFDVISAMFFSQVFQYMIHQADFRYEGQLPRHLKILMDEFVNCGYIPNFDGIISTIRSRNISATVILQELNQIKAKYKNNWQSIIGCCDTMIFMGSPENETREYISKMLGKTTVKVVTKSVNYGSKGGRSENMNFIARELMTSDELKVMPADKQVVFVKATNPIYAEKYKTETSELYQYFNDKADYKDVINKEDIDVAIISSDDTQGESKQLVEEIEKIIDSI